MQSLPKCFDSGLQYVHDLDIKKKKSSSEVFCSRLWPQGQHGAQPPAPASYLLRDEAKAKTAKGPGFAAHTWQPPEVTRSGRRQESWMTGRAGSTPGLHTC